MSVFFAAIHFIALALGFGGLLTRYLALRDSQVGSSVSKVFLADNLWGLAAVLWLVSGLMRAFGGLEKGAEFYLHSHWFYAKMATFGLIFLLELYPMTTLIRWRVLKKKHIAASDMVQLHKMVRISQVELALVLVIPIFATLMAKGY